MARKRMVAGWPCWFWMDENGVIQQFNNQKAPPQSRKGWVLMHDDASLYDLAPGLEAPWLNHDGTTRLLMRPIPVNDVEPVWTSALGTEVRGGAVTGALADAPDGGHVPGDDDLVPDRVTTMDEWDDRRLELEIEAEEKAKGKK